MLYIVQKCICGLPYMHIAKSIPNNSRSLLIVPRKPVEFSGRGSTGILRKMPRRRVLSNKSAPLAKQEERRLLLGPSPRLLVDPRSRSYHPPRISAQEVGTSIRRSSSSLTSVLGSHASQTTESPAKLKAKEDLVLTHKNSRRLISLMSMLLLLFGTYSS